MRRVTILMVLVLVAGLGAARAAALEPQEAAKFIAGLVGEALGTLKDRELSEAAREARFDALLRRGFDMDRIARFVLGRHWRGASEEERRSFTRLFERWVVRLYAARLAHYRGEVVRVTGAAPEPHGAIVSSEIDRPSAPPLKVAWRVGAEPAGFKILDINVEGVSMALTERDEIAAVIASNGGSVAGLNRALEQKLGPSATAARR
jgi:phospholipid transport system substrate-binding protein